MVDGDDIPSIQEENEDEESKTDVSEGEVIVSDNSKSKVRFENTSPEEEESEIDEEALRIEEEKRLEELRIEEEKRLEEERIRKEQEEIARREEEERRKEQERLDKRKAEAKKGISITRSLITFGFENWVALEPVEHRNDDEYIKETLKEALNVELKYLEEKRKIEEEAKYIMGKEMSKKMHEVSNARSEAYVSDSEDESDDKPKKNKSQLGILGGICLDSVYLNYLQEKAKNPPKEPEEDKKKKKKKRRGPTKPSPIGTHVAIPNSPRRNSSPRVVISDTSSPTSDKDTQNIKPGRRGRRASLQPGSLSPRELGRNLNLGEINEHEQSEDSGCGNLTPSPTPSRSSLKDDNTDEESSRNASDTPEQARKNKETAKEQEEDLLISLMKKNVKESEFTPEEKALYDARDVLWEEYERRKAQRKKIGALLRKRAKQLKGLLGAVRRKGESDLSLKARSNNLQKEKKDARRKKKRYKSYGAVNDVNAI